MIMAITKTNVDTRKGQMITIERETDAASPNLYQAASTNEVLPKVLIVDRAGAGANPGGGGTRVLHTSYRNMRNWRQVD